MLLFPQNQFKVTGSASLQLKHHNNNHFITGLMMEPRVLVVKGCIGPEMTGP